MNSFSKQNLQNVFVRSFNPFQPSPHAQQGWEVKSTGRRMSRVLPYITSFLELLWKLVCSSSTDGFQAAAVSLPIASPAKVFSARVWDIELEWGSCLCTLNGFKETERWRANGAHATAPATTTTTTTTMTTTTTTTTTTNNKGQRTKNKEQRTNSKQQTTNKKQQTANNKINLQLFCTYHAKLTQVILLSMLWHVTSEDHNQYFAHLISNSVRVVSQQVWSPETYEVKALLKFQN